MDNINPKQILLEIYHNSNDINDIQIDENIQSHLNYISERIAKNKGVYTVLITLSLYKLLYPNQDIRYHKIKLPNGFSGRSFDSKYVTPTLKELGLPAMAESGWLTRSLEQAYPYDINYKGQITPQELRSAFLCTVDFIQTGQSQALDILRILLNFGIKFKEANPIQIQKIENKDIRIDQVIELLQYHFEFNYQTHGGSKLPVIAFYAIYQILIKELSRFNECILGELGSHNTSDRTSKSGGDIEVFRGNQLFEALEIKLNKEPNTHMIRVAYEKINKFSINRYYIFSNLPIVENEVNQVINLINKIQDEHGCQLIVNGLYPSLRYYLRLISDTQSFLNNYIYLVENDTEIQMVHKEKLQELLSDIFNI